ncbi:hypothetical protein ANN_00488 [Periplaneta americana]|uniref:Mos1 transposase HTH domain-containing protein n=1 Tax=Periplaneta americana TaxID=6978 RepID=A0ABQ8TS26_PERAM|nr:hypothetical protein ANN_00488 [Periplaneta americana]
MATTRETRTQQRAVIEFVFAEQETIANIDRHLQHVYGDQVADRSTISRWVSSVSAVSATERAKARLSDLPRSRRPHAAVTPQTVERTDRFTSRL